MKKNNIIIAFVTIILTSLLLIHLSLKFNDLSIFQYSLTDVLTCGVVTFGIYYLTKFNDDKSKRNLRIENTIELIDKKIRTVFNDKIDVIKKEEYLHTFRYFDNKLIVLEKLCNGLECDKEINEIKQFKEQLDNYIMENINEGNNYFEAPNRKEKIPNFIENIESRLDTIVLIINGYKNS